jgi:hypothetical protein
MDRPPTGASGLIGPRLMSQDLFDEGMIDGGAPFPDASGNAIREIKPCLGHDQKAVLVGAVCLLARKLERIRRVPSVLVF